MKRVKFIIEGNFSDNIQNFKDKLLNIDMTVKAKNGFFCCHLSDIEVINKDIMKDDGVCDYENSIFFEDDDIFLVFKDFLPDFKDVGIYIEDNKLESTYFVKNGKILYNSEKPHDLYNKAKDKNNFLDVNKIFTELEVDKFKQTILDYWHKTRTELGRY